MKMAKPSGDYPGRLLGWWVTTVQQYAVFVVAFTVLATAAALYYSVKHFRINVDTGGMISEKLPFRKLENEFTKAFPDLTDIIVVVIDADTAESAQSARKGLAERLRRETGLFKTVFEPGGGEFFEKNGLLYLSTRELEEFADTMAQSQPLLGMLSRDLSLRGLFSVLDMAVSRTGEDKTPDSRIDSLFNGMAEAFESASRGRPFRISWQGLMLGEDEVAQQRRQFIIITPRLDPAEFSAGEVRLEAVRRIAKEMGVTGPVGVKVRITGDVALAEENLIEVRKSVGVATVLSFVLVGLTLYLGLGRSGRLVVACLATLFTGLVWTTCFAVAYIGSLNLISVTFAVLFIGLGIDYSIQFCLRYLELLGTGYAHGEGILTTARGVGRSLLVSCITIAIGFYSFVPTTYAGVGELGLISGTGMFISFFANLTVLPAILMLLPPKRRKGPALSSVERLTAFPYRYPKVICIGALLLGSGAALVMPRVFFDYNPLNLYDQRSEAVSTIKELFGDPNSPPWSVSVLTKDGDEAKRVAARLKEIKEVRTVITLADLVPGDQNGKLGIISDLALYMPPRPAGFGIKKLAYEEKVKALSGFERALGKSLLPSPEAGNPSARRLYAAIRQFKALLGEPEKGERVLAGLEDGLLSNLPDLLQRLHALLGAQAFDESGLPGDLRRQYVSDDGRYRVQAFPRENILVRDALERFITAVRSVAPDATDAPVTVYESGSAIVSSFRQATVTAIAVIALYLLIELKSLRFTALVLTPLALGMALTAASSVLLGLPFNFANVIIVPLLLGIGVHSSIILVLRHRTEPPLHGNMLKTSTARAVLVSSLTTIVSTASLSFSAHKGIAGMGMLLALCLGFLLICTLLLLPALLELSGRRNTTASKS